jgi:hypothetical protein
MKLRNMLSLTTLFCISSLLLAMDSDQTHAPLKLIGLAEVFKLTEREINQTRFYQAIYEGHIELVKGMVKHGKINPKRVLTCHSLLVSVPDGFGFLPITHRAVYADPNKFKDEIRSTQHYLPLTLAVAQNKFYIVRFLVEVCKVDINDSAKNILHPLFVTLDGSYNIELIQYLIDHGANPLYKNDSATPRTVLEEINHDLSYPGELGPARIAKLKQVKPIIEKALRTRNYPDPYADAESSSSSDSDEDTDEDTNAAAASADTSDSDSDDTPPQLPASSASKSFTPLPNSASTSSSNNVAPLQNPANHANNQAVPLVSQNQQAPKKSAAPGTDNSHQPPHHMSHTKYSWSTIALSALGITCGIVCIKKLYSWYTDAHEIDEDANEHEDDTARGEHDEIT